MMELCPNGSSNQEELDITETSRFTGRLSSDISISDSQVILIIPVLLLYGYGWTDLKMDSSCKKYIMMT